MVICINTYADKRTRCPLLGHSVPFSYCRILGNLLPCHKVLDCWHEIFDIQAYIHEFYSKEEIERFLAPPQPKINQILDLIKQARKRQGQTED